jgi:hypothetical protein
MEFSTTPLLYTHFLIPFSLSILFFVYWGNEKKKSNEKFEYEKGPFWFGCAVMLWAFMALPKILGIEALQSPLATAIASSINTLMFALAYKYLIFAKEKITFDYKNKHLIINLKSTILYFITFLIIIIATLAAVLLIPEKSKDVASVVRYPHAWIKLPSILFGEFIIIILGLGLWNTFEDRGQNPFKWITAIIMGMLAIYQFHDFWSPLSGIPPDVISCISLTLKTCFIGILFILTSAFIKETENNVDPEQLSLKLGSPFEQADEQRWLMVFSIGRASIEHHITFKKLYAIVLLIRKKNIPSEDGSHQVENRLLGHGNIIRYLVQGMAESMTASRQGKTLEETKRLIKEDNILEQRVYKRYLTQIWRAFFIDGTEKTELRVPKVNITIYEDQILTSLDTYRKATTEKAKIKEIEKVISFLNNIFAIEKKEECDQTNSISN